MKDILLNIVDALWIRKDRCKPLTLTGITSKAHIHPTHYLLHLASGTLVLALSVGIHVLITNQLKHHRMVRWANGELETNYSAEFPLLTVSNAVKLEMGIMEDGSVVYRISK